MSEQIKIEISPVGAVKVSVQGVAGSGCKDLTKAIEASLGVVTEDTKTGEFYQTAKAGQVVTQGG
jgi:hypothetical protein